jgi:hypothetical protein
MKMTMLKLKISTKGYYNAERWDHKEIDSTPRLMYEYNQGTNWKANDYRLADQKGEVYKFEQSYWEQTTIDPSQNKYNYFGPKRARRIPNSGRITTNLALYETELEREIDLAIERVNKRFEAKYKRDFETHFEDPVVKFVKDKQPVNQ